MSLFVDSNDGYQSGTAGDNAVQVTVRATNFYGLDVVNTTASVLYVMVFDSATTVVDGYAPLIQVAVPANSSGKIVKQLPLTKWNIKNGLFICSSSTPKVKTLAAAGSMMLYCYYTYNS